MLRSCKYCGRIHDAAYDCGRKPVKKKRNTDADKFRWSKAWQKKREEIRVRDNHRCQVCARLLFHPAREYETDDLSVHHAIPIDAEWDRRLDNDNLLTLCGQHHEMAERGVISYEVIQRIIDEQERKAEEDG